MDPENITLANALEATGALICRQLPQHIKVGPMPVGAVTPLALPLRDLNGSGHQLKHFFDVIYDHDGAINFDALAPIFRDKAWRELRAPLIFGSKKLRCRVPAPVVCSSTGKRKELHHQANLCHPDQNQGCTYCRGCLRNRHGSRMGL